ncbi:hypothetical protein D9757_010061 [Collybiopsis confluens]|uniref:DUF6536 domain-containing protein n=1 Tax=Collybiopsis confluens TaxID=2823264 RepID=A0A8H5LYB7_9AGAR|nr:hypothetical protein D9757_010061 [Collybiopsis confluens]
MSSTGFLRQVLIPQASYAPIAMTDSDDIVLSQQDWKPSRRQSFDSFEPSLLDDKSSSSRRRLPTGWRFGAWSATLQALLVLLVNLAILIWSAATRTGWGTSSGLIFEGHCNSVNHIAIGIHLLINILSTILLGASNYIMQSLCAPTRLQVDRAHQNGTWLDIGMQSMRNLGYTSRRKRVLWILLAASSIPLHLFYNSAFFSTLSSNEYRVELAQGPDLSQSDVNSTHDWTCSSAGCPTIISDASQLSSWEILTASECLETYTSDFMSDRSHVIAIVGNYTSPANANILNRLGYVTVNTNFACSAAWRHIDPATWSLQGITFDNNSKTPSLQVRYCISKPVNPRCQLEFNLPILVVVILFNAVKVVCMAIAAVKIKDNALVTIGDAINSFVREPDTHTKGMSLASRSDFESRETDHPGFEPRIVQHQPMRIRWIDTTRKQHWVITLFLCMGAISVILGLLGYAVHHLKSNGISSITTLWRFGIGKPHSQNIIQGWVVPNHGYGALLAAVLISNSPQLILSVIYLIFNNLCTMFFLSLEWSSYSHSRKYLRVSSPEGNQRSTYFIQIPLRFGLPLMLYSTLLHWLVSQSIFLVKVTYWRDFSNGTDVLDTSSSIISCGYSPMAMILTCLASAFFIFTALGLGFNKCMDVVDMPLVGSCSAAIAAACHPPLDGGDPLRPLKWGAVIDNFEGKKEVGHVCFSSGVVVPPIPGFYH